MITITEVLTTLAAQRPIFHSEADFQHAFAWEIHRRLPDGSIRLERPFAPLNNQLHLDIWAAQENTILAVELKYKTRALSVQLGDERFTLKNQSAQDIGRYDFIKDIQRLEQIISSRENIIGYAILLTNDSAYWTRSRVSRPVDADFRLQEGRILHGTLSWGEGASEGTKRTREKSLELGGTYKVHWEDYSRPSTEGYGTFRYLAIEVNR